MIEETWQMTNRYLPVIFARGYMYGLYRYTGSDIWLGYYTSALARCIPEQEKQAWKDIFYPYHADDRAVAQPLDYAVLRLLHVNILDDGTTESTQMRQIARAITMTAGRGWWIGAPPLSGMVNYGLHRLLTPYILRYIDPLPRKKRYKQHKAFATRIRAIESFASALRQASGINCSVTREQSQIIVTISECPFCMQHPNCFVFWGVLDGLLAWIHGHNTLYEFPKMISLNPEQSQSHRIVLTLESQ